MAEMSVPALAWPERARQALEALYEVAREYDELGLPIERLAREAGRANTRIPVNPLPVADLKRSLRTMTWSPPVPMDAGAPPLPPAPKRRVPEEEPAVSKWVTLPGD